MILADKIIKQRKKNGWSQEELAEKMNVSRQAVSKWESAQSTPDLEKILQLSKLFGVTTDYLLKDENEEEEFTAEEVSNVRKVSIELANSFLEQRKKASVLIAIATFLCILSVVPLIILTSAAELTAIPISENVAAIIGLFAMFLFIAIAVSIFIFTGFKSEPFRFIEKEPFENEYGVTGMVKDRQRKFRDAYVIYNIAATVLCVLSPLPLIAVSMSGNELLTVIMVTVTLVIAGIGAFLFIIAGVREASMKKLLREGEFSDKSKKRNALTDTVGTFYWIIVTTVYLAWSFGFNAWDISWVVWPISAVMFSGVCKICELIVEKIK